MTNFLTKRSGWPIALGILALFSIITSVFHFLAHEEETLPLILGQGNLLLAAILLAGFGYYTSANTETQREQNHLAFHAVIIYLATGSASAIYASYQYLSRFAALHIEGILFQAVYVATIGGIIGIWLGRVSWRRVQVHSRLQEEQERFRRLFSTLPTPVIEYAIRDGDILIQNGNPRFKEKFDIQLPVQMSELDDEIIPSDRVEESGRLRNQLREGEQIDTEILRHTTEGNRWFRLETAPRDGEGFAIYIDITEPKTMSEQLLVMNRVLRHNLRNNLNAVRGYADILEGKLDKHELEEYADSIEEQTQDTLESVESIRTALETLRDDPPKPEPTEIVEIVRDEETAARESYPDAVVETSYPDEAWALAHPVLGRVIDVLIENAVRHNDKSQPKVRLTVQTTDGFVTVRIADNGPGLPEQELVALQAEREPTSLTHASGVDLWMARWFVEQFGGTVQVQTDEQEGTTITIRMKRVQDTAIEP